MSARVPVHNKALSTAGVVGGGLSARQITRIAELHYLQGLSQKEIAREVGVHASSVSRALHKARTSGLVRVSICPPAEDALGERLRTHLDRKWVRTVIVRGLGRRQVGAAAARYFEERGRSGATLVLDGGLTIGEFVDSLIGGTHERLTIIPIAADPPSYQVSAYEFMTKMAVKFPTMVTCVKPPLFVTKVLDSMHRQAKVAARRADFVFLGVAPWRPRFTPVEFLRHLGLDPVRVKRDYRQVTAMSGYIALDRQGREVHIPPISDRMRRSLTYADVQRLTASRGCETVLIAASRDKATAVLTALKGKLFNTLIIDQELGEELLMTRL